MKNHERFPTPYLLGHCANGTIYAAGLEIGKSNLNSGSVVCIKTNGGALITLEAPTATTNNPAPTNTPEETENEETENPG